MHAHVVRNGWSKKKKKKILRDDPSADAIYTDIRLDF